MMEFDIGYVPHGWKRGEPLMFRRPGSDWAEGYVERDAAVLFAQGPHTGPIDSATVHQVRFRRADEQRVAAWLQWWRAERQVQEWRDAHPEIAAFWRHTPTP